MVFYKNKQILSVVVLVVVCVLIFLILRSFFRYGILLVRIDAGIKKYKDQSVRGNVSYNITQGAFLLTSSFFGMVFYKQQIR